MPDLCSGAGRVAFELLASHARELPDELSNSLEATSWSSHSSQNV